MSFRELSMPKPQFRRKDLKPGEVLCEHCTAKCCRYFALPIDTPKTWDDFDSIRWYMTHGRVSLFVDEGTWYLMIHADCRYLLDDQGVVVVPGRAFGAPLHFRISYAYALQELQRACERITAESKRERVTWPFSLIDMSHTRHKRSSSGFSEHRPLDSASGSMGMTRPGK